MATIHPSHRRLQPLAPSIDRHFEQYLLDHHHFPKLPAIQKSHLTHRSDEEINRLNLEEFLSPRSNDVPAPPSSALNHGPISRLLNSEAYRRAQARLAEYRQQSKIPGIALTPTNDDEHHLQNTARYELPVPLKEAVARTKQHDGSDPMVDDDDSVYSDQVEGRRRAKHWIQEHQFFFTEYQ